MTRINEATDTDLKIIDDLKKLGWKTGDTLLYQQEYALTPEQQKIFEEELEKNATPEVIEIKKKARIDENYEPSEKEIEEIKKWTKNPKVYLDEGQLQKVYNFKQGSMWDFFLHALKIRKIPTPKERVEKGFESYIRTYNFSDKQTQILRGMKDIVSANISEKKKTTAQEVFNNPVYARIIGADYQDINQIFDNRFPQVFEELQTTFKI